MDQSSRSQVQINQDTPMIHPPNVKIDSILISVPLSVLTSETVVLSLYVAFDRVIANWRSSPRSGDEGVPAAPHSPCPNCPDRQPARRTGKETHKGSTPYSPDSGCRPEHSYSRSGAADARTAAGTGRPVDGLGPRSSLRARPGPASLARCPRA